MNPLGIHALVWSPDSKWLLAANADNGTVEIFYGKHGAVPGEGGHITIAAGVSPRGTISSGYS